MTPAHHTQRTNTKKNNRTANLTVQFLTNFISVCFISATKRVAGIENQLLSSSPEEFTHMLSIVLLTETKGRLLGEEESPSTSSQTFNKHI